MRRWAVVPLVAIAVAMGWLALGVSPVAADHGCAHTPWPRFSELAPTARRIIVGTVVEYEHEPPPHLSDRGTYASSVAFRLRVDEVLRGRARERLWVAHLTSGMPLRDSRAKCGWLSASLGDRIAIAFRGRVEGVDHPVTTVAWVDERPSLEKQGVERLTLKRVRALAGHERDGSSLPVNRGITPPTGSLGDTAARQACTTAAATIPSLGHASRPTVLVAAYRMSAPEVNAFASRLDWIGEGLENIAEIQSEFIDVCVLDGRFAEAELPRALVALRDGQPPWVAFAQCHPTDIPLDFERAAPLHPPKRFITRC